MSTDVKLEIPGRQREIDNWPELLGLKINWALAPVNLGNCTNAQEPDQANMLSYESRPSEEAVYASVNPFFAGT